MTDDKKKRIPGKRTSAVVTEDASVTMPIGSALTFKAALVGHDFQENAVWLQEWESFDGMLLMMQFGSSRYFSVEGSAVLVGPGIALCATHVIEPHLPAVTAGKYSVVCTGLAQHAAQFWRVIKVTPVPESDLTILGLIYCCDLPPDNTFPLSVITTRVPDVGEKIMISGFRAADSEFQSDSPMDFEVSGQVLACTGTVTNVYPKGRDKVLLPWSTFEVECPTFGGMSGGPAFDDEGKLIGVLCASLESEEQDGPSYVSMLWPSLGLPFEGGWPTAAFPGSRPLIDLDPRVCHIDGRGAIRVVQRADGEFATQYGPWSRSKKE